MATFSGVVDLTGSTHTIALGATEDFDPNVTTTVTCDQNFVVRGTLRMHPANSNVIHTLRFINVNEANFVGGTVGGMSRTPVATDVGLWVVDTGVLDAIGDRKVGWNRTGDDPTWDSTDTMLRVPWAKGDYTTFAAHAKGDALQSLVAPDGSIDVQECFNLTRNVRIEGTSGHRSHIFISSDSPQVIKYVAARYMGPRKLQGPNTEVVRGRWVFHLHHMSDAAARASILEGCVARDGGSHAFVPHGSNGVTFRDCIAYNCNTDAFWWDVDVASDASADVLYDRCLVARIPIVTGEFQQYTISGFRLQGTNGTVQDSVCVGNLGARTNPGFEWPEPGGSPPEVTHGLWANSGNVAHNNAGVGIYFWQNDHIAHQITDFRAFRNGGAGVIQGAYGTASHWDDVTVYDNNGGVAYGHFRFLAHSRTVLPSRVNEFHRMVAQSAVFGEHSLPPVGPAYIFDSQLTHAYVSEGTGNPDSGNGNPAWYWLIRCDLEPADWTVYFMHPTSVYWVQRSDNTAYQVNPNGTTTVISQFYFAPGATGTSAFAPDAASLAGTGAQTNASFGHIKGVAAALHGTGTHQQQMFGTGAFAAVKAAVHGAGTGTSSTQGHVEAAIATLAGTGSAALDVTTPEVATPFRLRGIRGLSKIRAAERAGSLPYVVEPMPLGSDSGTPAFPSNRAVDDILLLFLENPSADAVVPSVPSGWTELPSSPQKTPTPTNGTRLAVYWKRCTMTEASIHLAERGDHVYAVTMAIRGCVPTGDPWEAMSGGVDDTASTSLSIPGVTTTAGNRLVVFAVSRGNDLADSEFSAWTNSALSSLVDDWTDGGTIIGNGGGLAVTAGNKLSAGSVGATTVTISSSVRKAYITFALRPLALSNPAAELRGGGGPNRRIGIRVRPEMTYGNLRSLTAPTSVRGGVIGEGIDGGGNLAAAAAALSGLGAAAGVIGVGSLAVAKPAFAATGTETISATGNLAGAPAVLAGTGAESNAAFGDLAGGAAAFAGTGANSVEGMGTIGAAAAAFASTGIETITGTSAYAPPAPTLAGVGSELIATGTGAFAAGPAALAGEEPNVVPSGVGAVTSGAAAFGGTGNMNASGPGTLSGGVAALAAAGVTTMAGTATFLASASQLQGIAFILSAYGTGSFTGAAASFSAAAQAPGTFDYEVKGPFSRWQISLRTRAG